MHSAEEALDLLEHIYPLQEPPPRSSGRSAAGNLWRAAPLRRAASPRPRQRGDAQSETAWHELQPGRPDIICDLRIGHRRWPACRLPAVGRTRCWLMRGVGGHGSIVLSLADRSAIVSQRPGSSWATPTSAKLIPTRVVARVTRLRLFVRDSMLSSMACAMFVSRRSSVCSSIASPLVRISRTAISSRRLVPKLSDRARRGRTAHACAREAA